MPVDGEHLTVQFYHVLQHIVAISLILVERELEVVTLRHVKQFFLKGIQCDAETCEEMERLLFCGFLHHLFAVIAVYKQTVAYGNVFMNHITHSLL